ncbi:Protein of unknown function [Propionibacterium freudenreichii subsp. freudenreichii]
MRDVE